MWVNAGDVKRHLKLVMAKGEWPYDNCQLVRVDVGESYHDPEDHLYDLI